ncbi:MAG: nitronate monooxygenase [Christensenellales bacterium]|jgi:enoyl-[acyl-carrier protein] reductase II
MIQTPICSLFGIEYPIFQGGMAWVADADLAAAVSRAGGLGIISAMNADANYLAQEIDKCAAQAMGKPFGVNIMLMSPFADDVAQVVIDKKVPVVTTGAGLPSKYMAAWIKAGIKVVPVVPSTAIARRVEKLGACAVIAEGGEAGGHVGDLTTMTLVPQVADAVSIPVIAAGGIGDGRGVAAAFMLGASGVQCGTRFLTAKECNIHQNYKDRVLKAKDTDTMLTGKRLGHPVRALKSPFSRKLSDMEYDASISNEEIEALGAGSLRKAVKEGDEKAGSFMAGQAAALVKDELTAGEIIIKLFKEAESCLGGACKWVR